MLVTWKLRVLMWQIFNTILEVLRKLHPDAMLVRVENKILVKSSSGMARILVPTNHVCLRIRDCKICELANSIISMMLIIYLKFTRWEDSFDIHMKM